MRTRTRVHRLEPGGPSSAGLQPLDVDMADFQSALPQQNVHVYSSDPLVGINVGSGTRRLR